MVLEINMALLQSITVMSAYPWEVFLWRATMDYICYWIKKMGFRQSETQKQVVMVTEVVFNIPKKCSVFLA